MSDSGRCPVTDQEETPRDDPEMVTALRSLPSSMDLFYRPGVVRRLVVAYRQVGVCDDWDAGYRYGLVVALGIVLGTDETATVAWLEGLPA